VQCHIGPGLPRFNVVGLPDKERGQLVVAAVVPREGVKLDFAEIEARLRPPAVVVGALDVSRDFSDVRDIVRGYHLAIAHGEPGEVYNLGAERDHTVRAMLETLIGLSGIEIRIVQDPARMRGVDVPCIVADCSKLRALTGWRAEIPFETSLRDVLDYWREQVRIGATDPTPPEMRLEERAGRL